MSQPKKPLNREGILNRVVTRTVPLDDDSSVCIRALSAKFIVDGAKEGSNAFDNANLLVHSLCDENGQLLFTEGEKDQVMVIDHKSLKAILEAILDLNGLTVPRAGEVSAPEKN